MEAIGKNIKRFRESLGFTQNQLAEFLAISREQISYWENGSRTPSLEVLERICDLFAIDLEALLEEDSDIQSANMAVAFRVNEIEGVDLKEISSFNRLAKNYLKMMRIYGK